MKYVLGAPAADEEIRKTEQRLGVSFPVQVKMFYQSFNGLKVDEPKLEVLSLEKLNFTSPNYLHFATFDGCRSVYFDISHINVAEQWNIVDEDNDHVTLTMASFWSNRIWYWIDYRRVIWKEGQTDKCDF